MKSKNYSRKVEGQGQLYRVTEETKKQILKTIEELKQRHNEELRMIKANYDSNREIMTLSFKRLALEISSKESELNSIKKEMEQLRLKMSERQKELSKDGKRDYIAERDDTILVNSQKLLKQYERDHKFKAEELKRKTDSLSEAKASEEKKNRDNMESQVFSSKNDYVKGALLSKRELSVKGIYNLYKKDVSELDNSVKTERNNVNQVNTRMTEIESEFNAYKDSVKSKYEKEFQKIVAEKKKDRKEYRKFVTRVYVIPEELREQIIKNGYISSKELHKLEKKSPMEMEHDRIEVQIQAAVNKKFAEYKEEIAQLEKVRAENMPALEKVEGQKAKLKEKLTQSIKEITNEMLKEAKNAGIALDERDVKKSSELFKEVSNNDTKKAEPNAKKTTQNSQTKTVKAPEKTKKETVVKKEKKEKKGLFGTIISKIQGFRDRSYERKIRKQEAEEEAARKKQQLEMDNMSAKISLLHREIDNLSTMVTSQDELSGKDSVKKSKSVVKDGPSHSSEDMQEI